MRETRGPKPFLLWDTLFGSTEHLAGEWVYGRDLGFGKGSASLDGARDYIGKRLHQTLGFVPGAISPAAARNHSWGRRDPQRIDSTRGVFFWQNFFLILPDIKSPTGGHNADLAEASL